MPGEKKKHGGMCPCRRERERTTQKASLGDDFIQRRLQVSLASEAAKLLDDLTALEEQESRNGTDAILYGKVLV